MLKRESDHQCEIETRLSALPFPLLHPLYSYRWLLSRVFKTDSELRRWLLPLFIGLLIGSLMTASMTALLSSILNANPVIPSPVKYHSVRNLHIEHLTSSVKMEHGKLAQNKSTGRGDYVVPAAIKVLKIRNFGGENEKSSNQTR